MSDLKERLRERYNDPALGRLVRSDRGYQDSHGNYLPELAQLVLYEREQIRKLEDALRPFAEKWDLNAADYLAELVDGEEVRIIPARIVDEMIEDIKAARAVLAATDRGGEQG